MNGRCLKILAQILNFCCCLLLLPEFFFKKKIFQTEDFENSVYNYK